MIKAVIYDMDDLMVNSCALHEKSLNKVLEQFNYRLEDLPPTLQASFVGRRLIDILNVIIEHLHLPADAASLNKEREQIFLKLAEAELEPLPGLFSSLNLFYQNKS